MKRLDQLFNNTIPSGIAAGFAPILPVGNSHLSLLSTAEIKQFHSFNHDKRRHEFLSARVLIKELAVAENLPAIHIKKKQNGAPVAICGEQKIYVSMAHADNATCGVLSKKYRVGIDIEPAERSINQQLRSRIMHPEEVKMVQETGLSLVHVWTLKEAFAKMMETGLRKNFNEICIEHKNKCTFSVKMDDLNTARISSILFKEHIISIAYL